MPLIEVESLTDELERILLEGESDPFDAARAPRLVMRGKDRRLLLTDEEGRPCAQAAYLLADVAIEGVHVPVAGLSAVFVPKSQRGRGLAKRVVQAAQERMRSTGRPFGLLFCHEDRTGLYERLGWTSLSEPVVVDQPRGAIVMPMRAMRLDLAGQEWPPGAVRLLGLPF